MKAKKVNYYVDSDGSINIDITYKRLFRSDVVKSYFKSSEEPEPYVSPRWHHEDTYEKVVNVLQQELNDLEAHARARKINEWSL